MSNVKYRSGDFTVAAPVGGVQHESPLLPFLNEVILFHQDFVQLEANFEALDYNAPHPTIDPPAYLINESPRTDFGGNCVRWTRTYARVPSSYAMPGGIYQYHFPGIAKGLEGARPPTVIAAKLTVQRDFFLCGEHGAFPQWQDIPSTPGFIVLNTLSETPETIDEDTTPTFDEYQTMVANNTPIQIEDSKITPIFGSVFVRENLFVIAR